jgi:hypothetical protein
MIQSISSRSVIASVSDNAAKKGDWIISGEPVFTGK